MVQYINNNHMQITLSILSVIGITVTTSMSHSIGTIEIYLQRQLFLGRMSSQWITKNDPEPLIKYEI